MAFRTEARIGAILIAAAMMAGAQTVEVRHKHLHGGATGELEVTGQDIIFFEYGKARGHSRIWKYEDIQQVELSPGTLRILTYEDQKWKLGLDREYVFDHLPPHFAQQVYPQWKDRLDARFVAALPDARVEALWQVPVKLLGLIQGSQGTLLIGMDRIVYRTETREESRTWRFTDIENIASAGRFDFSIVTHEREFRFQLKEALGPGRFDELWRRLNGVSEPEFIRTSAGGWQGE